MTTGSEHEIPAATTNQLHQQPNHPEGYVVWDEDLRTAAEVAKALGKPLLLTGDPGVGKSEFANWLAHSEKLEKALKFVVKSTTEGGDLFYTYDTLDRFHDAQIAGKAHADPDGSQTLVSIDPLKYITYQALGLAILNSIGRVKAKADGLINAQIEARIAENPTKTVVLIDEIDKAPRDVPNDILDEIDKMAFSVKEIGSSTVSSTADHRPLVIITSNSERDLPEPFLRRCVYYHMAFPEQPEHLKSILAKRLPAALQTSPLLEDSLKLFKHLRGNNVPFTHKPGLSELLDWLRDLTRQDKHLSQKLKHIAPACTSAKVTLFKHADDQKQVTKELWQKWLDDVIQ